MKTLHTFIIAAVAALPGPACAADAGTDTGAEAAGGTDVSLQLPGGQGDPAHTPYRLPGRIRIWNDG